MTPLDIKGLWQGNPAKPILKRRLVDFPVAEVVEITRTGALISVIGSHSGSYLDAQIHQVNIDIVQRALEGSTLDKPTIGGGLEQGENIIVVFEHEGYIHLIEGCGPEQGFEPCNFFKVRREVFERAWTAST